MQDRVSEETHALSSCFALHQRVKLGRVGLELVTCQLSFSNVIRVKYLHIALRIEREEDQK